MAYNVLVVDDSRTIRSMLVKTLQLTSHDIGHIFQATNGKEALDHLRENWIDLVLSDLNMPEMTGLELVDEMAGDGLLRDIPVIVISTDGSETRINELKAKGVREYIRKPFTPEKVGEAITRLLGERHEQDHA